MRDALHDAHALVHHRDALLERARRGIGTVTYVGHAPGDRVEIARDRFDLCRGLARRRSDLVGEARQSLVQGLDGVAHAFAAAGMLGVVDAIGEIDHAIAELSQEMRLFARRGRALRRCLRRLLGTIETVGDVHDAVAELTEELRLVARRC